MIDECQRYFLVFHPKLNVFNKIHCSFCELLNIKKNVSNSINPRFSPSKSAGMAFYVLPR